MRGYMSEGGRWLRRRWRTRTRRRPPCKALAVADGWPEQTFEQATALSEVGLARAGSGDKAGVQPHSKHGVVELSMASGEAVHIRGTLLLSRMGDNRGLSCRSTAGLVG